MSNSKNLATLPFLTSVDADDPVDNDSLCLELDRLEHLIGSISVATTGIAASIDCGDKLDATHVGRLFSLLIRELNDTHQNLVGMI